MRFTVPLANQKAQLLFGAASTEGSGQVRGFLVPEIREFQALSLEKD